MVRTAWKMAGFVAMVVVADIVALGIYYSIQPSKSADDPNADVLSPLPPSSSPMGVYKNGAVVSLGGPCPGIGKDMMVAGGNAVDAAIATLLCDGVCVLQSMGIGGGFLMTLYNKTEKKAYSLVARETAPAAATTDMYANHPELSTLGPMAAGVPGELKGYQAIHEKFGKLPWRTLFQPTIKLCEEGIPVNKGMADNFVNQEALVKASPTIMGIILNSTGGRLPKEGENITLPLLAQTLRLIADSPNKAEELYNGSLTKQFVADIQGGGGIITEQDMNDYTVAWETPYSAVISGGSTVYSAALPGSGILVTFMLRLMDGLLQFAYSDFQRSQIIIETFKHAYGRRSNLGDSKFLNATSLQKIVTELTDEASILEVRSKIKPDWTSQNVTYYGADYAAEDHGTDNIVVVDEEGNAISVTSTVNLRFGSKFVSKSTGILLNNQMDDFSSPNQINYFGVVPSEANFIQPGKRPFSSMSPTVVVDSQGNFRLALGASGGTMITSQVTLVALRNLWFGMNIKEAIDSARFHHQLVPMNVTYEYGVLKDIVEGWKAIGHSTRRLSSSNYLAVVTGIAILGSDLTANCDYRKYGAQDGF